jgi:hypothetical protein
VNYRSALVYSAPEVNLLIRRTLRVGRRISPGKSLYIRLARNGLRQRPQEQRAATLYCVSRRDRDGTRRLPRIL